MNHSKIIYAALIGAGMLASSAWAADSDSQMFITKAIQGNLAEISVGQLAQQKGSSDPVKQYGATLVSDHTKANQDAMDAAKALGVTPPTEPNDDQKRMHDKLAGESGSAFDGDFVTGMVDDHKKDVADYQKAAGMQDAAGQYAAKTLPTLQQHLAAAQSLAANTSMGGSGNDVMAPKAGANSFTEAQAKARIEKAGFANVMNLKKDDQGIWRGMANQNGTNVPVALDFKGNVSSK